MVHAGQCNTHACMHASAHDSTRRVFRVCGADLSCMQDTVAWLACASKAAILGGHVRHGPASTCAFCMEKYGSALHV